ncbi:MAG: PAS domain-containing protein [Nitrospirae bacterium]|nr:PAS domain-containing protein [Nitrospirota bacterium]
MVEFIVAFSFICQLAAAAISIFLIRVTGRSPAWILIAIANIIMALRRLATLYHIYTGNTVYKPDVYVEFIALASSVAMLTGIALIPNLLGKVRETHKRLAGQQARRQLASIVESADDAIFSTTPDGKILSWNRGAEEVYGYSYEQIKGLSITTLYPDGPSDEPFMILEELKAGKHIKNHGTLHVTCYGKPIHVSLTASPIISGNVSVQGASFISRDVSMETNLIESLKNAEARQRLQNEEFLSMFSGIEGLFYVADFDTYEILHVNPYTEKHHGTGLVGKKCYDVLQRSNGSPCEFCNNRILTDKGEPTGPQERELQNTITGLWYHCIERALRWPDGRLVKMHVAFDITGLKAAEDRINRNLSEKMLLLREIHHRVKNNMQIISSLINLQSIQITDKKVVGMFMEMQSRIRTMALIHEKLYQTEDLASVDFGDYVNTLATYLLNTYNGKGTPIKLKVDVKNLHLGIDTAIPCGLIINELVTNSLKYAFNGRTGGEIFISLEKKFDGRYELSVGDDGTGLTAGFDVSLAKSLGLSLVKTLAEYQLGGSMDVVGDSGTVFRITFDELKYPERI